MEQPTLVRPERTRLVRATAVVAVLLVLGGVGFLNRSRLGLSKAEASSSPPAPAPDKDKKEKEPAVVSTEAVSVGSISVFTTATANLVAEDEVKILAEAEGKVVRLLVEEGDFVPKGGTLCLIDPADAALAVQKAELGVPFAQLTLDRSEQMAAEKLISSQELDKARYERDLAVQTLAEARHRLRKTTVTAPFAGRVTVRKVQPGQNLKLGEELFTFADFDPLVARIFLPEREVLGLAAGREVRLTLRAAGETRFRGRIRQVSPVVDTASGTVKVTVEAVQPPAQVRPGAFVSVEVLRETRTDALLVPRPAIVRELQEAYVFVAEGKTARKRIVELGLEEGDRVEVLSGLAAGETVVTAGQGGLKDQSPITVAPATPAKKG
ncbi:MAG TPA: efflux RND transporter periplasmic adaptor subunit [Vicinamibacteria bacterium]|nr:efflux RND transporter periplasmic adaptor subunit [Vicinamibacteria bacterium]